MSCVRHANTHLGRSRPVHKVHFAGPGLRWEVKEGDDDASGGWLALCRGPVTKGCGQLLQHRLQLKVTHHAQHSCVRPLPLADVVCNVLHIVREGWGVRKLAGGEVSPEECFVCWEYGVLADKSLQTEEQWLDGSSWMAVAEITCMRIPHTTACHQDKNRRSLCNKVGETIVRQGWRYHCANGGTNRAGRPQRFDVDSSGTHGSSVHIALSHARLRQPQSCGTTGIHTQIKRIQTTCFSCSSDTHLRTFAYTSKKSAFHLFDFFEPRSPAATCH